MRPLPHIRNLGVSLACAGVCATFDALGLRQLELDCAAQGPDGPREMAASLRDKRTEVIVGILRPVPPFGFGGFVIE